MNNRILSEAIAEAYASAPADIIILNTLELRHPNFIDKNGKLSPIRIVNDHKDLIATLEDNAPLNPGEKVKFLSFAFKINIPGISDKSNSNATVTIDNVNRFMIDNIEKTIISLIPIEVTYRPYISTDLSGPQYDPVLHLTLTSVTANVTKITGKAKFNDLANLNFPNVTYTASNFPGLV